FGPAAALKIAWLITKRRAFCLASGPNPTKRDPEIKRQQSLISKGNFMNLLKPLLVALVSLGLASTPALAAHKPDHKKHAKHQHAKKHVKHHHKSHAKKHDK
ncbi:hypothetical protein, partial [Parachitinimonas caeni]